MQRAPPAYRLLPQKNHSWVNGMNSSEVTSTPAPVSETAGQSAASDSYDRYIAFARMMSITIWSVRCQPCPSRTPLSTHRMRCFSYLFLMLSLSCSCRAASASGTRGLCCTPGHGELFLHCKHMNSLQHARQTFQEQAKERLSVMRLVC